LNKDENFKLLVRVFGRRGSPYGWLSLTRAKKKEILEKLAKVLGIADRAPISRLRFRLCGLAQAC
jgi:hypothetical protein